MITMISLPTIEQYPYEKRKFGYKNKHVKALKKMGLKNIQIEILSAYLSSTH